MYSYMSHLSYRTTNKEYDAGLLSHLVGQASSVLAVSPDLLFKLLWVQVQASVMNGTSFICRSLVSSRLDVLRDRHIHCLH